MFISSYQLLTPPASEILTIGDGSPYDVAPQLRVVNASDYAYVSLLIAAARREIERRLERQLLTATWRVIYDSFPAEITLAKPPVQSVVQIQYLDMGGQLQTLDPSWYQASIRGPDSPARIMPAYAHFWPFTRAQTYDACRIDFVAGYGATADTVPITVRQAMMFLVAHWFENRTPVSETSVNEVPETLLALIGCDSWGAYS